MVKRRGRKKQVGMGLKSALGKVNKFLKSTKALSTVANLAANAGYAAPYSSVAGNVLGQAGYGRKRGRPRIRV